MNSKWFLFLEKEKKKIFYYTKICLQYMKIKSYANAFTKLNYIIKTLKYRIIFIH